MKNLITLVFFILSSVMSCVRTPKYSGYSETPSGINFRLEKIGENTDKAVVGDYITINITYKTFNDSVFFNEHRKFKLLAPEYQGSIEECFLMLAQGDAATFIIDAGNFFQKTLHTDLPHFIKPGNKMKVNVEMLNIQTEKEYDKEKEAFMNWTEDLGQYEKVVLRQFMEEKKLNFKPTPSGLYFLKVNEGTGKKVEKGDTVVIDYEGKFLNGKFFDSTKMRHEALQFVYGQQWQVIKGLEEVIGMMRQGDKALCILPSELAFGKAGSSTGIIPPYTSLIFEVELKSVK